MHKNIPSNELYEKITEWLAIYHSTDNLKKKAKMKTLIVASMLPVVKKLTRTIARRSYDPIEDMVQAGSIGLLKAIDRFSCSINDNFRVYAGYFIIGEIKHYLRDKLNTVHVPRHIQELCIRINNFTSTLTYEELQALTSEEVASALEVPKEAVDFALLADRRRSTLSIEEVYANDGDGKGLLFEEIYTAEDYKKKAENNDTEIFLNDIISMLPAEQKVVFDMYYNQDMNQAEISEALQISKMAVYRRLKSAFNIVTTLTDGNKHERNKMIELLKKQDKKNGFTAL